MASGAEDGLIWSPLHERQVAAGARFAEFAGWSMPLEYAGGGVLAEHAAVRTAAGLFDVSHLGKATVAGPGAAAFVNRCLTADLDRIGPERAQYTLLCHDRGGIVDDLLCYLRSPDEVFLIPNAANCAAVVATLRAAAPPEITVRNQHRDLAVLAVQGPACDAVVRAAGLPTVPSYMSFIAADVAGAPLTVCRTGYTGERGYELVTPAEAAGPLWDALRAAGEPYGLRPAGLAARDTLRIEMGYPLHGQDISPDVTPVQARLRWAVGWDKPAFFGRDALLAERAAGPRWVLRGLRAVDRGIPRPGMTVRDAEGAAVGMVTSGTFSPTLRTGIALALVAAELDPATEVAIDIRDRRLPFRFARLPFVTPGVRGAEAG